MKRPCNCERYKDGNYDESQCKLCWIYHHNAGMRRLWGGEAEPNLVTKVVSLVKAVTNNIMKGRELSEEERRVRLDICRDCAHYFINNDAPRCTKCGCRLMFKVGMSEEHCPIGKW